MSAAGRSGTIGVFPDPLESSRAQLTHFFPVSKPSDDRDASSHPEELFFAYLIQREEPEAEDFESLCARHPEHADALRVLLADYERVGGLLSKSPAALSSFTPGRSRALSNPKWSRKPCVTT